MGLLIGLTLPLRFTRGPVQVPSGAGRLLVHLYIMLQYAIDVGGGLRLPRGASASRPGNPSVPRGGPSLEDVIGSLGPAPFPGTRLSETSTAPPGRATPLPRGPRRYARGLSATRRTAEVAFVDQRTGVVLSSVKYGPGRAAATLLPAQAQVPPV
jgi:hypothetical protein